MPGPVRSRSTVRLTLAAALAALLLAGRMAVPATEVDALSRWTGGIDLYRSGVFTTQKTWLWCTAADVQIIRNIADHATDHSRSSPAALLRLHARPQPVRDPGVGRGRSGGLGGRASTIRRQPISAHPQRELRLGPPICGHEPAQDEPAGRDHGVARQPRLGPDRLHRDRRSGRTTRFSVTSVRVVGPLWGLQSRSYGYDMRPDTKLTPAQLKGFFTPWHYARRPDGLGGSMGVGPAGGEGGPACARDTEAHRQTHREADATTDPADDAEPNGDPGREPGRSRAGDPEPFGSRCAGGRGGTGLERGSSRRGGGDSAFRSGRRWSPDGRPGRRCRCHLSCSRSRQRAAPGGFANASSRGRR